MSFDVDEEILQDFLIEAGEILELLQEQLVALENNPDDADLLNAIFRGFHTVKGGAGFLSLGPMVDVCHEAENTFDLLRTGKRQVNAELMDIILQAVDAINSMFEQTQQGQQQDDADPALLDKLKLLSSGAPLPSEMSEPAEESAVEEFIESIVEETVSVEVESVTDSDPSASIDDIDESEFEALLDALHGQGNSPTSITEAAVADTTASLVPSSEVASSTESSGSDEITDDEFEALLDELHGSGGFKSTDKAIEPAPVAEEPKVDADDITDDEFEKLLDELHGKGSAPAAVEPTPVAPKKPSTAKISKPSEPVKAVPQAPAKKSVPVEAPKAPVSKPAAASKAVPVAKRNKSR